MHFQMMLPTDDCCAMLWLGEMALLHVCTVHAEQDGGLQARILTFTARPRATHQMHEALHPAIAIVAYGKHQALILRACLL